MLTNERPVFSNQPVYASATPMPTPSPSILIPSPLPPSTRQFTSPFQSSFTPQTAFQPKPAIFNPSELYVTVSPDTMRENFKRMFMASGVREGTKEQLSKFWEKYRGHETLYTKCSLDDRYFWQVLFPLQGLVLEPLRLDIIQNNRPTVVKKQNLLFPEEQIVVMIKSETKFRLESLKQSSGPVRLINVIIRILDDSGKILSTTYNLICVYVMKQKIERFEPLLDESYIKQIDEILRTCFIGGKISMMDNEIQVETVKTNADGDIKMKEVEVQGILPGFTYRMLNCHPQRTDPTTCASRGMSSAFVLKKAMSIIAGHNECPYSKDNSLEELKILRFVDAITKEYGIIP